MRFFIDLIVARVHEEKYASILMFFHLFSWLQHRQKQLVLSVMSSSRNRTFTNRSVLMPRFYTCETANPAISHVPYTWHAVRCILNAHCVPQRVFCSKSAKKAKGKVPDISKQTFQFSRSPGLSLSAVSPFSLKEKQGKWRHSFKYI